MGIDWFIHYLVLVNVILLLILIVLWMTGTDPNTKISFKRKKRD